MPKRRGHHEGTIRQRTDGRWESRISLPNGKSKSYYGKTAKEVRDKLREAQRELDRGVDIGAPRQTVGQFLDRWLEDVIKPTKEPKTHASYEEIVRLHLIPTIGRHTLGNLTPPHVAALLAAKSAAGLSPRRVSHIRAVLRNALNQAMRWGLVARNVASLVEPPRLEDKEAVPFTVAESRALLAAADEGRLGALFRLALTLGLRQGEILGLAWADVDLDAGRLRVRRSLQRIDGKLTLKAPKTEKSRRTLRMPPSLVAALRAHQDRQAFERAAAGVRWHESGLVFTTTIGTPLDPRNVIRSWHRLLAATAVDGWVLAAKIERDMSPDGTAVAKAECAVLAGPSADDAVIATVPTGDTVTLTGNGVGDYVPVRYQRIARRPFHTCRHTAASVLLAEKTPMKIVQEVLGHSLLSTTADIYSHLFDDAFDEAADAMERAFAV